MYSYTLCTVSCVSVGLLDTTVNPAKTAEPIEMPYLRCGLAGGPERPRSPIRWGVDRPPSEGSILRKGRCGLVLALL